MTLDLKRGNKKTWPGIGLKKKQKKIGPAAIGYENASRGEKSGLQFRGGANGGRLNTGGGVEKGLRASRKEGGGI